MRRLIIQTISIFILVIFFETSAWMEVLPVYTDTPFQSPTPTETFTPVPSDVRINELYYDSIGIDQETYTELIGPPGESLDGMALLGLSGHGDCSVYMTVPLDGKFIQSDGFFVIAQSATVPNYDMLHSGINWQNGPDSVQLVMGETIIDAVGYGDFSGGLCFAGEGEPAEEPYDSEYSLSRFPDGDDNDDNLTDFCTAFQSPGEANTCLGNIDCEDCLPLYCNIQISGSTASSENNIEHYGCRMDWDESGPETVYAIDLNGSESFLVVELSEMSANLDVFILSSCNEYDCCSAGDYTAYIENPEAGEYYIVVDGRDGTSGSYEIAVHCDEFDPVLDCSNSIPVECGETYAGSTSGGDSLVKYYMHDGLWYQNGPEIIHSFTIEEVMLEASLSLVPTGEDVELNMFLMDECNELQCISAGTEVVVDMPWPGVYYVVVDGPIDHDGAYNLTLTCTPLPSIPALSGAGIIIALGIMALFFRRAVLRK